MCDKADYETGFLENWFTLFCFCSAGSSSVPVRPARFQRLAAKQRRVAGGFDSARFQLSPGTSGGAIGKFWRLGPNG
jgi:hypothetical protein